jgi:TolB-like protein/tetratricopeptide (TPR) repeat protein
MSLVAELRRRRVFRVAAAYLVVGWLLTEVLTTILPTLGAPEWAPRAVILIFAFGFVPAVFFAWFFEITPEGIRRDHGIESDDPGAHAIRRRFDNFAIAATVILIIVIGLFSAQRTDEDSAPAALLDNPAPAEISNASVAVLPFVNMSNDKDNEYFSDGLTETLLHMLAQIPDLKVAARTSSFAFKGRQVSIQEIARALGVAHVLEGSVQRAGDRVRITAQLIRADDGYHVWSDSFDRNLVDIFGIQDEIAEKVGYALSQSLLGFGNGASGLQTTDPDAYDLYLQARKERATFSYGGLKAAEDLLKGALLIDPDFTEAKLELASGYLNQMETGLMTQEEAFAEIVAITDPVLTEHPDNIVARALSAFAKAGMKIAEGNIDANAELVPELEAIVAAAPAELQSLILLVRAYQLQQQDEKSVELLTNAARRDPFNPAIHYELGSAHMRLQQWDEARAALQKSLEIEPTQPNAYTLLAMVDLQGGDAVGFVSHFIKSVNVDPRDHELPGLLAAYLYRLGLVDIADDFRARVLALAPTSEVAYQIDMLRAIAVGDEVASVASARRAIEDNIDERRFSYGGAVQHLLRTAIREGSIDEISRWIEDQAPGIFDIEDPQVPQKYRTSQVVAFDAWFVSLPREELLQRLDTLLGYAESIGVDPTQNPGMHLSILAVRGETEKAIDVALEGFFSQSVAPNLGWRETFAQPLYEDIVADPRIQDAMRRWEEEELRLRRQVEAYFRDLQSETRTAQNVASAN